MCDGVGGGGVHGGVGGWRAHGVGAYTHPPIKSYNIKMFNFMNTHPPTNQTYPKCHSVTIHILWMVHGVDDGWWWVVEGFMGWVDGWWVVGWRVHGLGGGGVSGWRVYGVGGCGVVGWLVGEFMG